MADNNIPTSDEFSFNIFASTSPDEEVYERMDGPSNEEQEEISSQPKPQRQFIPKTPASAKIGRGERGALVTKMIGALRSQILAENENFQPERTVVEDQPETDLQGMDPEIRAILNGFGIFFFAQIPSNIITAYGPLLTRKGSEEDYQRMVEKDLLEENGSGEEFIQDRLKSQEIIHR